MKNSTRTFGAAFLSASMLLGVAPGIAQAAPAKPTSAISKFAAQNQNTLGAATSAEQCFANGTCAQDFENGMVTWNLRNGAHALTDPSEVQAFRTAGGAEKFGAIEGGSWKSPYCGSSVTTYDGTTRWMVVVDQKTQAGSFIDLNTAEANQWKKNRLKSRACIPNNAVVVENPSTPAEPENPTTPENSGTGYTVDFAAATAKAYEPYSRAAVNMPATAPTGSFTQLNDRYYVDVNEHVAYIYDIHTQYVNMMDIRVYNEWAKDPEIFGAPLEYGSHVIGDGRGGDRYNYIISLTQRADGKYLYITGRGTASLEYSVSNDPSYEVGIEHHVIDNEPPFEPIDPAQIDWSKANYYPQHNALVYQDGPTAVIIAAVSSQDPTPAPDAKAYRSNWLGFMALQTDRFNWNQYSDWGWGSQWGSAPTEASMLGLPVAEATTVVEDGVTYELQEFEGGSIRWKVATDPDGNYADPAQITLKPEVQAEYDRLWKEAMNL